jgi:hypothetical protein
MYELSELQLIRVSLDAVTIKGADAKFLAQLQTKVETDIQEKSNPPKTKK